MTIRHLRAAPGALTTYVEFGNSPDGDDVLWVSTEPDNGVVELRDDENEYDVHVRVTSDDMEVRERGHGRSHLDRNEILAPDNLRPERYQPSM